MAAHVVHVLLGMRTLINGTATIRGNMLIVLDRKIHEARYYFPGHKIVICET